MRIPRLNKAILRAPAFSLASQVTGLIQLGALLWQHGPSNATDAYFYLFNLGNLPTQILTVGVLYPMMLSKDRITRAGAMRFHACVPFVAFLAVLAGAVWLGTTTRISAELIPIIWLSAFNAIVQALLWFRAVTAEAGGAPHWVSGVALPANALATVVLLFPWPSSAAAVTAMTAALAVANTGFWLAMLRLGVGRDALERLPAAPTRRHGGHWWFLAKAGTSYGGLMIVQSISLVLPPATLTLLTLPQKIVGSVAATFVNAVMPVLVHQTTESPDGARKFMRVLALVLGPLGAIGVVMIGFTAPRFVLPALIVALWLVASGSAAVAQRWAFRFLPPSTSRVTIVVVPLIVVAVALSTLSDGFNIIVLLCAYAAVDAATSFLLLATLRDRAMAGLTGMITLALASIWILSLLG